MFKHLKTIAMMGLILLPCHFAFSATIIPASVPFENITLQPGGIIQAGYIFGNHPLIYCFENTFQIDPPVGTIEWTFNGQSDAGVLSVDTLTINSSFQGNPADPAGLIEIQNTSTIPLVVSCQFGF